MTFRNPFGGYRQGDSKLHLLDPRIKLVGLISIVSVVLLMQNWSGLLIMSVIIVLSALMSQSSISDVYRDVRSLWLFYILTIVIHILIVNEKEFVLALDSRTFWLKLQHGLLFATKIALLGILAGVIQRTTHPSNWTKALESILPSSSKLGKVIGKPALVLGLSLRLLPMLLEEAGRIRMAQVGRGLKIKGSPIARARTLLTLLIPLFYASLHRAECLSTAMQVRGFNPDQPRGCWQPLKMQTSDWLAFGLIVLIVIVAIRV